MGNVEGAAVKGNTFINDLLKLIFNATPIANLADNAASAPLTNLYVSLHTADPGAGGSQTTNEAAYGSYARVAVARTAGGFTVTGQTVAFAATVGFPAASSGSETETHWAVGTAASGAGKVLYSGALGSNLGPFTALAGTETLTIPNLGTLAVNDRISFSAAPAGTLPTGIASGTLYFVKTVSGDQVTISATAGGAALDVTADGNGYAFKHTPLAVTSAPPVTPQIQAGTFITEG